MEASCKDTAICVIANAFGMIVYAPSLIITDQKDCSIPPQDQGAIEVISAKKGDRAPLIIYLVPHIGPGKSLAYNEIAMKQNPVRIDIMLMD